ncbi:MAG: phage holin family protein [Akkermansiaceae bacterium]|nr:phage holin family protein [Akkermansiaceae bacterium]
MAVWDKGQLMSTPSGTTPTPCGQAPGSGSASSAARDGSWIDAFTTLVSARAALLRHESKSAIRQSLRIALLLVIAALGLFFTWLLLLAGGVAALAVATGWPWYWLAMAAAALHLIAAGVCLAIAKSTPPPAFPLSRNEFSKDREWLQSLNTRRK